MKPVKKLRHGRPVEILLVEDNPGDVRLVEEAFIESKIVNNIYSVMDGVEAIAFLRSEGSYSNMPRPDIILLDLNLPKKDGFEVLAEIKSDQRLKRIPVLVMSTSKADKDILKTYDLHVSGYIIKPVDLDQFTNIVRAIEDFWFTIVVLPENGGAT